MTGLDVTDAVRVLAAVVALQAAEIAERRARRTTGGPPPPYTPLWRNGASSRPSTAPKEET